MANSAFQQPATPSPLPVANGGTGATSLTSGQLLVGAGTSAVTTATVSTGLALSGGNLTTIQDIRNTASPVFSKLQLSGGGGTANSSVGVNVWVDTGLRWSYGSITYKLEVALNNAASTSGQYSEGSVRVTTV